MISIDTNLLLYSLNPASMWHGAATAFLQQQFGDRSIRVVLTDYVLVELYVLLRNPAVMAHPLTPNAARDLVTGYLAIPNVMRIENANVMDAVWKLAGAKDFARRRVFDARLALTLRQNGVTEFATANVKDFEGWGFSKVWNPLAV
ncbi:MAG: VapC toxin family PIN domain ribonuclease [Akkermansiaceae bacterium]|nr:VapC toxin family PIN domain ribonuclease [Akkermansiaceae bacterium]